jgi:hypothetical protein
VVIKKSLVVEKKRVEFRDASLPENDVGNRGNELSRAFGIGSLQNNGKKGIRM